MGALIRLFFRAVRLILSPVMKAWAALPAGPSVTRSPERQKAVDAETARMSLYQYETCPFCIRVRRELKRLGLKIELRDARGDLSRRQELEREGGQVQVPCLRIEQPGGKAQWMYESAEIIRFLQGRFGT